MEIVLLPTRTIELGPGEAKDTKIVVGVGVVHLRAVLVQVKFVGVGLARLYVPLGESAHPVHPFGRARVDSIAVDLGAFAC
jgi:hypothetical protein